MAVKALSYFQRYTDKEMPLGSYAVIASPTTLWADAARQRERAGVDGPADLATRPIDALARRLHCSRIDRLRKMA